MPQVKAVQTGPVLPLVHLLYLACLHWCLYLGWQGRGWGYLKPLGPPWGSLPARPGGGWWALRTPNHLCSLLMRAVKETDVVRVKHPCLHPPFLPHPEMHPPSLQPPCLRYPSPHPPCLQRLAGRCLKAGLLGGRCNQVERLMWCQILHRVQRRATQLLLVQGAAVWWVL
jgi:hypothetical protein